MAESLEAAVREAFENVTDNILKQMQSRAVRVAQAMKNAELEVIRGQGTGRVYRIPGTGAYYRASAPGCVPAVRTGAFRLSWQPKGFMEGKTARSLLETDCLYAGFLEDGTSKMAPRPHHQKILDRAKPNAIAIYNEPYV